MIPVLHNTLHLRYRFPSRTDEDEDYDSPDPFEATFTAGSMVGDTACNSITIVDDLDLEDGLHDFGVRISGSTPSGSQISTVGAVAVVQIEDNDGTYY